MMDTDRVVGLQTQVKDEPLRSFLFGALLFMTFGCAGVYPTIVGNDLEGTFPPIRQADTSFATPEILRTFDAGDQALYRIGPGDVIAIDVFARKELSGKHIVGPDGRITLNVVGPVSISGLSSEEAAQRIEDFLSDYYINPLTTVRIDEYKNNEVLILGRVATPGPIRFNSQPTILETLARAGALPVGGAGATQVALTRCAVFRGRDTIIWVDIGKLLNGEDMRNNIRLAPNDVVYIPDAQDQLVYVMGEVGTPGAYHMTPGMSFLDALAKAGGPTRDSSYSGIVLVRPYANASYQIDLGDLLEAENRLNIALQEGDIIYVPLNGMGQVGWVMEKLSPATNFVSLATAALIP